MDRTKKQVGDILSKAGQHDTSVHEQAAPAVEHQTIKPHQHEEINTAVEQEVHQDHYHTTVQPVKDSEILPEQHKHRVAGTQHREYDHRDNEATERALKAESGKLRDERHIAETTRTQSHAPTVQGEHVHHHVHETIQPLVQKEIIQPEVVHTTVPVHEVHHEAAKHHGTTENAPMSMDEFKKRGGGLTGSSGARSNEFEGCPPGQSIHSQSGNMKSSSGISSSSTSGMHSSSGNMGTSGIHESSKTTETKKPSLLDRMNPMKDADGDGKKGFMS
ncbi:hypothetical protein B0H66DRAFT_388973 [Apodospora peruviana]|uniref:Allergen n=1 Tax=Apodospora peruviana TaxID=516989 RepID=A0AAE0HUN9_9PEZI|nr:hypothetical protein B0H66DRAFT_388973 [Apodospora peruviana]